MMDDNPFNGPLKVLSDSPMSLAAPIQPLQNHVSKGLQASFTTVSTRCNRAEGASVF